MWTDRSNRIYWEQSSPAGGQFRGADMRIVECLTFTRTEQLVNKTSCSYYICRASNLSLYLRFIPHIQSVSYKTKILIHTSNSKERIPSGEANSIWRVQNMRSAAVRLHRSWHWWSPVISSAYGADLETRMWNNILYAVDEICSIHRRCTHFEFPWYCV